MNLSFTPPTDPAYTRFLEGLHSIAAEPVGRVTWRWQGSDQMWRTYDPRTWAMEDVGAADTSAGGALYEWGLEQKTRTVQDYAVPPLFEQLKKDWGALHTAHPNAFLLWAPLSGGTWRAVFKRNPPLGKDGGGIELSPAALRRIAEVHEYERLGEITHEEAQKRIVEIVAEYT
jgi:hypothetical protein